MNPSIDPAYARELHALRKRLLQELASVRLTELAPGFPHEQVIPRATYAPWRSDPQFLELLEAVKDATLIDIYRLHELYSLAGRARHQTGDMLEVGVWRGGSAAVLGSCCKGNPDCKLWLADTFSGVPLADDGRDTLYRGGEHADTTIGHVHDLLGRCGVSNYEILVGRFPQETSDRLEGRRFRLVHLDVDTHESARDAFDWVWPRVEPGAVVVFDDFGFWGCEGVTRFVGQLMGHDQLVVHNLNGHALVFKRP